MSSRTHSSRHPPDPPKPLRTADPHVALEGLPRHANIFWSRDWGVGSGVNMFWSRDEVVGSGMNMFWSRDEGVGSGV